MKYSKAIIFSISLISGITASVFVVKWPEINRISSSGTAELISTMTDTAKIELLSYVEKSNNLVAIIKEAELNANNNSSRKDYFLEQAAINRKEISNSYTKMANILGQDLANILLKKSSIVPQAKEMILGLEESAYEARKANSFLPELHPQANGFIKFGFYDLISSMNFESKDKILNTSNKLNILVSAANKSNQNNNDLRQSGSVYQEISLLYLEISSIMDDNMRFIRLNNPRIVTYAKDISISLKNSSIKAGERSANLPEFHPQKIRY
jgi:hypothetical protein